VNQNVTQEQITIPAHVHYLPAIRNFIASIAYKYRFTKNELNALTISVDEACTNIIKHGYVNILSGSITMNVNVKSDRLVVELIDQGKSFDPNQVGDPNISQYIQVRKKGGLGIFIIRKFMDEIQYVTTGQENILRLIKLRASGSSHFSTLPINVLFKKLKEKLFSLKKKGN